MKKNYLLFATILFLIQNVLIAQNEPQIDGDTFICPFSSGTVSVVNGITYDTYQWYFEYFGVTGFEPIEGATNDTFTYDWENYDAGSFKLIATLGGETLESNILEIDSYWPLDLIVFHDYGLEVIFDPVTRAFQMCPGDVITNTVNIPYTICQWYKDGEAIDGATETTYLITEPGLYTVIAAPDYCPNLTQEIDPIVVEYKQDCSLSIDDNYSSDFVLYPNPAKDRLIIDFKTPQSKATISIFDLQGRKNHEIKLGNSIVSDLDIDVSGLSKGLYFMVIELNNAILKKKFIKR